MDGFVQALRDWGIKVWYNNIIVARKRPDGHPYRDCEAIMEKSKKEQKNMNNNVKNTVENIATSMAIEGMICTEDEKKMMEQILEGKITIDEAMQSIDEECEEFYEN